MKGVVFCEFLEMIEKKFSLAFAEGLLEESHLESGGVYTAMGYYDASEMVTLVTKLHEKTKISIPDLLKSFGEYLFQSFLRGYPHFFEGKKDSFDFLSSVNDIIHVDVQKLYPDAELPRFSCQRLGEDSLIMDYESPRAMGDVAEGLILATFNHFGEKAAIEKQDLSEGKGIFIRFTLTRKS